MEVIFTRITGSYISYLYVYIVFFLSLLSYAKKKRRTKLKYKNRRKIYTKIPKTKNAIAYEFRKKKYEKRESIWNINEKEFCVNIVTIADTRTQT